MFWFLVMAFWDRGYVVGSWRWLNPAGQSKRPVSDGPLLTGLVRGNRRPVESVESVEGGRRTGGEGESRKMDARHKKNERKNKD